MFDALVRPFIKAKSVFYFSSKKIYSEEPHNFIIINVSQEVALSFSVCTSKRDTILRYIRRNGYHEDTLVELDYGRYEFLKTPTFINCNSITIYSGTEFSSKYSKKTNKPDYRGELLHQDYDLIIKGLLLSDDISQELKKVLS